jgi:hypothetical protein
MERNSTAELRCLPHGFPDGSAQFTPTGQDTLERHLNFVQMGTTADFRPDPRFVIFLL